MGLIGAGVQLKMGLFWLLQLLLQSCTATGLVLITQVFQAHEKARQDELVQALIENLDNPYLDHIYLLQEGNFRPTQYHPKLSCLFNYNRLSFAEAFQFANDRFPEQIVMFANGDIRFDETLRLMYTDLVHRELGEQFRFYALSRHELPGRENDGIGTQCDPSKHIQSYDTFIFKAPVPKALIRNMEDVYMGQLGSDPRLVYEATRCGYKVRNPCYDIQTWHYHAVENRKPYALRNIYEDQKARCAWPDYL